ncbi:MAG: DNA polymerase domain-containing protein [Anaerolineales bacterium]|nr:MAG: DNA polymerase domain-containing protein [Anaerolineales bacterium]
MNEQTGWLLDVYADAEDGLVLWLFTEDNQRLRLRMNFPVTFYAAGEFGLLRQAWIYLKDKDVKLERITRRDLFLGERDVMAVTLSHPSLLPALFADLSRQFPSLDYYDADIPLSLRFIAQTNAHLLGKCRVTLDGEMVQTIQPLDSPWEVEPAPIPLRILTLSPDVNPAIYKPKYLHVQYKQTKYRLSLESTRAFLISLKSDIQRFDPDLILTDYGDTWLFPQLEAWAKECGIEFNPNRDESKEVLKRRADSYFAYGQVVYRGAQAHLFGRWHIDRHNAMSWGEYGLEGAMEQARVTGLGVQEMARKSPGAGITAMQMLTALRNGIMVPVQKQQVEGTKTLIELIRADHGGLIYQPLIGVHGHVAQIDFSSMYPAIIVKHNISPETVGLAEAPDGLIPKTLRPLVEKRLALKNLLVELDPRDCRAETLKARAAALKWLLVVCFGYLGYKNARFGKIESHEAVTAVSRELMLQAKEVAEDLGFTVLHMYVDCLFVQQAGFERPADFTPLMEAIVTKTGIPIALEGVFKWVAFLSSKRDKRVPVPNQYFGAFLDGSLKYRGIELRRRDTTTWVRKIQLAALNILTQADSSEELVDYVPAIMAYIEHKKRDLQAGRVPVEELIVRQKLSRVLDGYKSPSPAARAARQLQAIGREIAPGQSIEFLFTRDGVHAWELGEPLDVRRLDIQRYCTLLDRAMRTVLDPCEALHTPMQALL